MGTPDIVIGGVRNSVMPKEQIIGKTHIIPTSVQGKLIGVADVSLVGGQMLDTVLQMVPVDKNVREDEAVRKEISDFLTAPRRSLSTTLSFQPLQAGKESRYYDSASCKVCHPNEYEDWRKTDHARALRTLKSKDRLIPECLQCYSEEFRETGRYSAKPAVPAGVECATCHAAVLPHGTEGPALRTTQKVDAKTCLECHTSERSPAFNASVYMPLVAHESQH